MASYRDQLLQTLSDYDGGTTKGGFVVSGVLPSTSPELHVEGLGLIKLPLAPTQAQTLKEKCERAPFGKGAETALDERVRDTWQLDAAQVQLQNPEWEGVVLDAVARCCKGLGLGPAVEVQAQLYKLLLYEKGGHFKAHRDTEKADGMFATLAITLPSAFSGGSLVVRHGGKQQRFNLAERSASRTSFVAFFADCEHEVEPVKSGHRLCLVYNLIHRGEGAPPTADCPGGGALASVRRAVQAWQADPAGPEKLCYLLEHRYTKKGLTGIKGLKGADRAAADLLVAAAKEAGLEVFLANVAKKEVGYCAADEDDWYLDADDMSMEEVCHEEWTLSDWSVLAGGKLTGSWDKVMMKGAEEVVQDEVFVADLEESDRRVEVTGNEGVNMDKWYRCGALVMWPASKRLINECNADIDGVTSRLTKQLAKAGLQGRPVSQEQRRYAEAVLQYLEDAELVDEDLFSWEDDNVWDDPKRKVKQKFVGSMLKNMLLLDDAELASRFVSEALPGKLVPALNACIAALCKQYGWKAMRESLAGLAAATLEQQGSKGLLQVATLLLDLVTEAEGDTSAAPMLLQMAQAAVSKVAAQEDEPWTSDWRSNDFKEGPLEQRLVTRLVAGLLKLPGDGAEAVLAEAARQFLAHPQRYEPIAVLLPACENATALAGPKASQGSEALCSLLRHMVSQLEARSAVRPQAPKDWAKPGDMDCDCKDCAVVAKFMQDAKKKEESYRWTDARRSHVEHKLAFYYHDVKCSTEKAGGRQYALLVTKYHGTYERNSKQYQEDQKAIKRLRKLLPARGAARHGSAPGPSKRQRR